MTALSYKRGGSRRHRNQGKRRTHRKGGARRKRQMGGQNVVYFYEAFAENVKNNPNSRAEAAAIAEERRTGVFSNYYTRTKNNIRQALSSEDFDARFNDKNIIFFMYDGLPFATSEQALAFAKARFFDPGARRSDVFKRILCTNNPFINKTIGSDPKGYTDAGITYKITFARKAEDGTPFSNKVDANGRPTPATMQYVGSLFKDWAKYNVDVMFNIQLAKFRPVNGDDFMYKLLDNTGDAELAEAAPGDTYWGIGYSENGIDPDDDVTPNPAFSADKMVKTVDGKLKWPVLSFQKDAAGKWKYERNAAGDPVYVDNRYAKNNLGEVLMEVREMLRSGNVVEKDDPPVGEPAWE